MPTLSPYVPFDWKGGDEITASQLDHLEQGVAAVTDAVKNLDFDVDVPTKVSDLINDIGYITSYIETDPTVPAWAKATAKPTYTATEVGALSSNTHIPNTTAELINDAGFITNTALPTRLGQLVNDVGYITNDDIQNVDINNIGKTLIPIYLGDYICPSNYCPSSSIKINNNFYAFDCQVRQKNNGAHVSPTNNEGVIRKFNLTNNAEVIAERQSNAIIGHANSVAFDGTYVYIVPEWSYTVVDDTPTETPVKILYKYNDQMEYVGTEEIPTDSDSLIGVSYDSKNSKLYCYTWNRKIYIKEDNNWTYYSTIDMTNIKVSDITYNCEAANGTARSYNQDFAVYDGKFYLSSPSAVIISGVITEGTTYATEDYIVSHADIQYRFNLGELEGFEFDNKGHLYATMYSGLYDGNNCFIVELPIGTCKVNAPSTNQYNYSDGTLTLSSSYQNLFWLESYRIRSINQLEIRLMRYNSSQITIPAGDHVIDDYYIRINDKIRINIAGYLTVKKFQVANGCLNLATDEADDNNPRLTITTNEYPIEVTRSGELKITGQYPLRIDLPNKNNNSNKELIHVGYSFSTILIREKPIWHNSSYNLTIGDTILASGSFFTGSNKLSGRGTTHNATYITNSYFSSANVPSGFQLIKITANLFVAVIRLHPQIDIPADTSVTIGAVPISPETGFTADISNGYGEILRVSIGDYISNGLFKLNIKTFTDIHSDVPLGITDLGRYFYNYIIIPVKEASV